MNKLTRTLIPLAIASTGLLSGCATIISGTAQTIAIDSAPTAANVVVRDEKGSSVFSSETPASVTLKRGNGYFKKKSYQIEISKDGYETQIVDMTARANGWYVGGNLLFGGLVGWLIVDPLSGAMYTLTPKKVNADLEGGSLSGSILSSDRLHIVLLKDTPVEWRQAMVRVQ